MQPMCLISGIVAVFQPLIARISGRSISLYTFRGDILQSDVKKAWTSLRKAALHYLRVFRTTDLDVEQFRQRAKTAHEDLKDYAKRAQRIFGVRICTYNLHTLVCRGYDQEIARGPSSREKEFWLERKIQELKQRVKYRAKSNPEAVLVNDWMQTLAIEQLRAQNTEIGSIDGFFESSTLAKDTPHTSPLRDILPNGSRTKWVHLRHHLQDYWRDFYGGDCSGWTHEDIAVAEREEYKRCIIPRDGTEIAFHSEAYRRSTARSSYYVHVIYEFQGEICHHVAKIKKFLLLFPPRHTSHLRAIPLALARLYDARPTKDGRYTLTRLLEVEDMRSGLDDYPIKVGDIRETLIACIPSAPCKGYFILDDPDEDV